MRVALKLAIFASGQSQRQIAAQTGIPENKLSAIVRGWRTPSDAEAALLANVLRQPADHLFAGERLATPGLHAALTETGGQL